MGTFISSSRVSGTVMVALSHTSSGVYDVPTVCQVLCWGLTSAPSNLMWSRGFSHTNKQFSDTR